MGDSTRLSELRAELEAMKSQKPPSVLPAVGVLVLIFVVAIGGAYFAVHRAKQAEVQMIAQRKPPIVFEPSWSESLAKSEPVTPPSTAATPAPAPIMSPVTAVK